MKATLRQAKGERGFTLLQSMIVMSIMIVLVGLALPMFRDVAAKASQSQALQFTDAASAALRLDFYKQIITTGQYTTPFSDDKQKVGKQLRRANKDALEAMLQIQIYPQGFKWVFVQAATPISPPVVVGEVK